MTQHPAFDGGGIHWTDALRPGPESDFSARRIAGMTLNQWLRKDGTCVDLSPYTGVARERKLAEELALDAVLAQEAS